MLKLSTFFPYMAGPSSFGFGSGVIAVAAGALLGLVALPLMASADEVSVAKTDNGVEVKIGDKPFTSYLFRSGTKPVLWPIIGPTGKPMTRAYPLDDSDKSEKQDHIHHRSLWFTHGKVNGISFWDENKGHGDIVHKELISASGGPEAKIVTKNDWIGPDGKKVCEDLRTIRLGQDGDIRWIDFTVVVTASEGELVFGDTKEGSFGVRVAESMKGDKPGDGHILNSEGQKDGEAWGKRAAWVDYFGTVQGETVGVTILNHPSSFRYPSYWHVRTYGLFAANPFGVHDFTAGKEPAGDAKLAKGERMTLRYRVLFHGGASDVEKITKAFEKFAADK
ncbi:MAG: PmoA family protein [Planctomycetaceae bacterium]